jgi:hypothetical protein
MKTKSVLLVGMLCCVAAAALGQRSVNTDDAGTSGKGAVTLELGADYVKARDVDDAAVEAVFQPYYGVVDWWDTSVVIPFVSLSPAEGDGEAGIGDVSLWEKFKLLDEEAGAPVGLAVLADVKLPTGDDEKGLGSGKTDVNGHVAVTKTLGPAAVHGNVGYTYVDLPREDEYAEGEEPENSVDFGLAAAFDLAGKATAFAEVYGSYISDADDQPVNANVGVAVPVGPVELDVHGDFGLTDATDEYIVGGGIAAGF